MTLLHPHDLLLHPVTSHCIPVTSLLHPRDLWLHPVTSHCNPVTSACPRDLPLHPRCLDL